MYILDTDTLSHLHAGNRKVIRAIQQLDHAEITTTIITKIEMLRGRIDYILKAQTNFRAVLTSILGQHWGLSDEQMAIVLPNYDSVGAIDLFAP
ncbi:MAG: hypothetical protein RLZZ511_2444 [Cyanobacteriota bacterium]|jgi:predicted nucleic acid-binding protein